jgi:hypothetical protein
LTMFVLGKTIDGVDRGAFNLGADNAFAVTALTGVAGDVNQDNVLSQADVAAMAAGWGKVNLVNGVRAGDVNTINDGDLNFDGVVNLKDVALLRDALGPAAVPGIDLSILPVPEPSMLAPFAPLAFWLARRRRSRSQ